MIKTNVTKIVQQRLLEMAKIITEILDKNNIPYMITYGTLLGAVRHQGFIPWDDDFDLFLFDDSYEKAIKILDKELPKDMFLEYYHSEPKYFHQWAHVKDLNSEVICEEFPQDNIYTHKGISIDLYKAVKMKFCEVNNFLEEENKKYLERRKAINLLTDEEYEKRIKKINEKLNKTEDFENENDDENRLVYCAVTSGMKHINEEDIFPLKKYKFENLEFYGPSNANKILKYTFGDYMKLPPIENRKSHYSSVIFFNK